MKASEIRKMSGAELSEKLVSLKKDLFFLRMQHATNQLDNPLKIAEVKRDIARVKTIIREQQTAAAKSVKEVNQDERRKNFLPQDSCRQGHFR